MKARLYRHPNLTAAGIFAVLAILFVSPGLMPGRTLSNSDSFWFKAPWAAVRPATLTQPSNPEFDDAPSVLQPFVRTTKESLTDIPLWNPHIMSGRPFEADAQSAVFSPYSIPAYLLPFFTALGWIAALKLWAAGFGMFLLGRRLGMHYAGAMVAGVIYGFNLWEVAWLAFPHSGVWALIPWMMLFAERAIRRPDVLGAAPLAVVVAFQFLAGHPESSFHALVATTVYALVRLYVLRPGWRAVGVLIGAGALGTALAAVMLIPFADLLLHSADIHQRSDSAQHAPRQIQLGLTAFFPDWYGRPTQLPLRPFLLSRAWYGSAIGLLLATVALVIRPSRGRVLIAALGAACMMVVLAIPPVFQIVTHLPIFSSGHNGRLAILALLCLALLAGFGMTDLLERAGSEQRRRRALFAAAAMFALPLLYGIVRGRTSFGAVGHGLEVAWGFVHPDRTWSALEDVVRTSAMWIWLVLGGAGLAVIALGLARRPRVAGTVLAVLAVGITYGDLARAGMGYNPAIKRSVDHQVVTPAIRLLKTAGTARIVGVGDIPQDALAMNFGLYEPRGYDLPIEQRYDHLWRTTMSEFQSQGGIYLAAIPLSIDTVTPARVRVLGFMGTRYLIIPPEMPRLHERGLQLVHAGPDAWVYRDLEEQPRAAVVGAQAVVDGGAAAMADVIAPGFRIDRAAVTEDRVAGVPVTASPAQAPAPNGRARIVSLENDSLTVDATARRRGMVVVSDSWAPGWTAKVDGHDATVHRVDYVYRGVAVGPGRHRIVFEYQPASWTIGWVTSLVALVGLLVAVGFSLLRRRRAPVPVPAS